MARIRAGVITYSDDKLMDLLKSLAPGSPAYNFFVKDAMRKAVATTKKTAEAAALAAGYPNAPGTRMTQGFGKSRPYKVYGRIPRAIRSGRFVLKRRDNGNTSQRVIIGQKGRGGSPGAPHGNITRYSKNIERFTSKGYSRGKFAAKPFLAAAIAASHNVVIESFKRSYIQFARRTRRST